MVFGLDVAVPPAGEYVADGAARQAAWVLSGRGTLPPWPALRRDDLHTMPAVGGGAPVRHRYLEVRDLAPTEPGSESPMTTSEQLRILRAGRRLGHEIGRCWVGLGCSGIRDSGWSEKARIIVEPEERDERSTLGDDAVVGRHHVHAPFRDHSSGGRCRPDAGCPDEKLSFRRASGVARGRRSGGSVPRPWCFG